MKSKFVILSSLVLMSVTTFAQKDQIKAAEKELSLGNSQSAITILSSIEYLIFNAKDEEKSQFFYVKGNTLLDLANKNIETGKNLSLAAKAFQELIAAENESGKSKYTSQALTSITDIKSKLVASAIADSKSSKFIDGANKIHDAYLLDKKDTINLYYAASAYVNGKDYVSALKLYEELKTLNYSGISTNYYAFNRMTKEEESFVSVSERDLLVNAGTHDKPRTERGVSKRGEIYKNIALIYVQEGKIDKAKKAILDARKKNPEDLSLTLTEANLYLETKDFETYKKLISAILEKNPNDPDLIFNLGVISANAKNAVDAEKYYKKVIEINPNYINAYINLAALKLEDEKAYTDEMSKLGTSPKDMKRYDELKLKRDNLFKSIIPYLEKAVAIDPKNVEVTKTLLSTYNALEMTAEYKALKAKV